MTVYNQLILFYSIYGIGNIVILCYGYENNYSYFIIVLCIVFWFFWALCIEGVVTDKKVRNRNRNKIIKQEGNIEKKTLKIMVDKK